MKLRGTWVYLSAIAALLTTGLAARADSVTVTANYTGDSPAQTSIITSPYLVGGYGSNFYVGASNFTTTTANITSGGSYNTDLTLSSVQTQLMAHGGAFQGFCIDLAHIITPGTYSWDVAYLTNVQSPVNGPLGISDHQASAIKYLWGTHGTTQFTDPTSAATFQMALWMLLYEPIYAPATVATTFSNVHSGTAAGWALDAWTPTATSRSEDVYALISRPLGNQQSFSIALVAPGFGGGGTPNPVPLPDAAGVGFAMLAGFGALFAFRKHLGRRARIA